MNNSEFTDKMIAATLKAEQDVMAEEANLNNRLFRRGYRKDRNNITFSDVQIAAITNSLR